MGAVREQRMGEPRVGVLGAVCGREDGTVVMSDLGLGLELGPGLGADWRGRVGSAIPTLDKKACEGLDRLCTVQA